MEGELSTFAFSSTCHACIPEKMTPRVRCAHSSFAIIVSDCQAPCLHSGTFVAVLFLFTLLGTTCSRDTREQHIAMQRHVLQRRLASLTLEDHSEITYQKGIVIPCGGARQLANAYVGLLIIRNYLSCDLPVEIAYYGSNEMDDYNKALFQVRAYLRAVH